MSIQHFSHEHPLGLLRRHRDQAEEVINCNACEQLISSDSSSSSSTPCFYSCQLEEKYYCKYYLHKCCAELEKEIHNHPRVHPHNLVYLDHKKYVSGAGFCDLCVKFTNGPYFRCVRCDFNIDLPCFPFPKVVKLESHRHHLTLSDPPISEEEEEEVYDDQYVCDACENDLDPTQPIYSCTKHDHSFIAHQVCGIITKCQYIVEENLSLAQKLMELDLDLKSEANYKLDREPKEEEIKPPALLTMVVYSDHDSILEGDQYFHMKEELNGVFEALISEKVDFEDTFLYEYHHQKEEDRETNSFFETINFTDFMQMFGIIDTQIDFKLVKITSEIVEVGNYMIPNNLAPTLEALFAKYGDISEESTLMSPIAKSCVVSNLCDAIHGMQNTKFVQLSENQLFSWWLSFKYAQNAGFKVQFLVDRLKRVMRAKMIVRFKAFSQHIVEEVDKRNEEIQLKLKELNEKRANHVASTTPRSKFKELCLREGLELKWKYSDIKTTERSRGGPRTWKL